jgi:hypothetical protein
MSFCWYCYWGWPKPVYDIYAEAVRRLGGSGSALETGPSHAVWADENFDLAESSLQRFDDYDGNYSDETLNVVRWSLEELAKVPLSVRCPEPEGHQNTDGAEPKDWPPPNDAVMINKDGSVRWPEPKSEPLPLKRFALFGGDRYYPNGGWNDLVMTSDLLTDVTPSVEQGNAYDAVNGGIHRSQHFALGGQSLDWWQIIDLTTGEKLLSGGFYTDDDSSDLSVNLNPVCLKEPPPQKPTGLRNVIVNNPADGVPVSVDGVTIGMADQVSF